MNEDALQREFVQIEAGSDRAKEEKLKAQLKHFVVKDARGAAVGEVTDLYRTPNGQLNLVVSAPKNQRVCRQFLLNSKLVHKLDPASQSLFVILSAAQIEQLLEYVKSKIGGVKLSEAPTQLKTEEPWLVSTFSEARATPSQELRAPALHPQATAVREEVIPLREERLLVKRSKQQIGEVIVRKEVETHIVEVPIRREKLIVEQVSPECKQLAEINLTQEESAEVQLNSQLSISGEFTSAQIASEILNAIAHSGKRGCLKVRLELVVDNPQLQEICQEWFSSYAGC